MTGNPQNAIDERLIQAENSGQRKKVSHKYDDLEQSLKSHYSDEAEYRQQREARGWGSTPTRPITWAGMQLRVLV